MGYVYFDDLIHYKRVHAEIFWARRSEGQIISREYYNNCDIFQDSFKMSYNNAGRECFYVENELYNEIKD